MFIAHWTTRVCWLHNTLLITVLYSCDSQSCLLQIYASTISPSNFFWTILTNPRLYWLFLQRQVTKLHQSIVPGKTPLMNIERGSDQLHHRFQRAWTARLPQQKLPKTRAQSKDFHRGLSFWLLLHREVQQPKTTGTTAGSHVRSLGHPNKFLIGTGHFSGR